MGVVLYVEKEIRGIKSAGCSISRMTITYSVTNVPVAGPLIIGLRKYVIYLLNRLWRS
jgi:hypothetical protein